MARTYKLPDGTITEDPTTYGDAWCALGEKVAAALGPGWIMSECNPGFTLRVLEKNSRGHIIERDKLDVSLEVALRLVELHSRYKETEPPKRTAKADVCYQQDAMGNGCGESAWVGGQWGVPKCHNPEHHNR